MPLKLYFLRHGQTEFSRANLYCGSLDPDLTESGTQMAQAFADHYRTFTWDAVYVSPRKRTIATAKPLCDAIQTEMHLREGLIELNYGKWEGETVQTVQKTYHDDYVKWLAEPAWNPPTGGETAVEAASRSALVITEIQQHHSTGNVLIVAHKGTIRIILCNLLGIDLGRFRDRIAAPVASVSVVKFDEHGPLLEQLGNRDHLSEALQNLPGT
ncbi:MAG: histidine phosphatase family protein [Myxacorys californica WJT36-NPBG1]|jgi:probable phosphoglycerate mutase|nr:histidine phosphatase family protein [Myxacorys californica WJT36-NPBG1]